MNILFINDNEPSSNIGCRATAHGFRKISFNSRYKISNQIYIDELREGITPGDVNTKTQMAFVLSRLGNISQLPSELNISSIYRSADKLYSLTPTNKQEIQRLTNQWGLEILPKNHRSLIKQSDIVLINGEGSFYKDRTHARMMLYYAYLASRLPNTKCVLSNLTLSFDNEFINPGLKSMATFVLPQLDEVIFREPHSYAEYTNHFSGKNCTLAADVAFASDNDRYDNLPIKTLFQLLEFWNDRAPKNQSLGEFVCIGGNSLYPVNDTASPPVDQYVELIKEMQKSYSIILVPSKESDELYMRYVAQKASVPMVSSKNSLSLLRRLLSEASVYIGGRYHPAVFALSGETPIICFSTKQNKNEGLIEHSGIDSKVFDAYRFSDYKYEISQLAGDLTNKYPNNQFKMRISELENLAYKNYPKDF